MCALPVIVTQVKSSVVDKVKSLHCLINSVKKKNAKERLDQLVVCVSLFLMCVLGLAVCQSGSGVNEKCGRTAA